MRDLISEFCSDQYKIFTQFNLDSISYRFQPKAIQVMKFNDSINIKSIIFTKSFIRLYDFVKDKSIIIGTSISVDSNYNTLNFNVANLMEKISIIVDDVEQGKFIGYYVTYKGKHFNVFWYDNVRNYKIDDIRKVFEFAYLLKSEDTTIMIVFSDVVTIIVNKYGSKRTNEFDYIKMTIKLVSFSFDMYKVLHILDSLKTNSEIIIGSKIIVFKREFYSYTAIIYGDNVYNIELPYCGSVSFKSYKFVCFRNKEYYVILLKKSLLSGEEVTLASFVSHEDIIIKLKKFLNRLPDGHQVVLYHYRSSVVIEYNSSFVDLVCGTPFSLLLKNSKCETFGLNKKCFEIELFNIIREMKCKWFNYRIENYKYL